MAGEFKGLTIKFKGDASDLSKALATINGEMRSTSRNAAEVERILRMRGASGNVQMLAQKVKLASDRCQEWKQRIDTLKAGQEAARKENEQAAKRLAELGERTEDNAEEYDELTKTIEKNNAAYERAAVEIERAQVKLEAYTREMHLAEATYDRNTTNLGKLGKKMQDIGTGMKAVGDGMQVVGGTLTKTVTAPLVALGTVSVKSAVEVDTALTGVRKTLDATESEYQALKDAAIESSKVQPVSAATILDIEALGAQLGFGISELQEFSRVASGLDVATNMSWEDAATNMAQFANIMKMSHDDVGRYGSTIVDLGNHFATTESDVSNMAMRIAAAGKQLGMSEADVLGMSAALTSMGVTAEAGGSSISTIMSNIDKDVAMQNENLKRWAEVAGMSADEFAQAWGDDCVGALARVLSGMEKATTEGSSMAVMLEELGISSIRQTDIMKRLAGNTELMTDAVYAANDAWEANTALDAEVANRNESMASKFQVLANKLTAIATEVGGPLADALLDAVDAAEPLIEKAGDLATAFAKMDEGQQRSTIKWAAMAAAAGPLLTVFGKLTSGAGSMIGALGKGAEGLSVIVGQLKRENGLGTAVSTLTESFEGAETSVLGLKVALGGLALGATILVISKMTERWRENRRRADELTGALDGMKTNTEGIARAFAIGATGIKEFGDAASLTRIDVDDLLGSLEEHNRRNAETRSEAEQSIGMLNEYKEVVDRLAGAGKVSAEDMGLLEWALKGIEEQTGKTYDATDVLKGKIEDENGSYIDLKDSIDKVIDAKKREAETSAIQSMLTDTMTERLKAEQELSRAQETYERHYSMWAPSYIKSLQEQGMSYEDASRKAKDFFDNRSDTGSQYAQAVDIAAKAVQGLTKEEETYTQMLANVTQAEQEHWGDRESIIMTTEKMRQACEDLGFDAKKLAQEMQDAGISTEDFAKIGGDDFAKMAQMAGGSMEELVDLIGDYNATEFATKYGELHVDGEGQVVDALGRIYEWNGTEFVQKSLNVETNAAEAAGEVEELNQSSEKVKDRKSDVSAKVKGKKDVDALVESTKRVVKSVTSNVTAKVRGKGDVDNLLSTLANANGRNYSVTFTTYQKTIKTTETKDGPRARGAIISHAAGDILMANRRGDGVMWDSYNRIGEQGAEAIVPLQRPFADGFAEVIAESLSKYAGVAGGPTYNLYVDRALVNGDAEIQTVMLNMFSVLMRKGAMNVG